MGSSSSASEENRPEDIETEESEALISSIQKNVKLKLGYVEEGMDECFPSLTYQQRLWGFGLCLALGMVLSYMSGFYLVRPAKFAMLYTTGNLFALCSTMFLMGPAAQIQRMFHPDRAIATGIYLGTMVLTVIVAVRSGSLALVLPLIVLQYVALIWYSLSYVPFGQRILKACMGYCCKGVCC